MFTRRPMKEIGSNHFEKPDYMLDRDKNFSYELISDYRTEPKLGDMRIIELPIYEPHRFRVEWYGDMKDPRIEDGKTVRGWRPCRNWGEDGVFRSYTSAVEAIEGPKIVSIHRPVDYPEKTD
jgi:hypothetical protein